MNKEKYFEILIKGFEELPMRAKSLILEHKTLDEKFLSNVICDISVSNIKSPIEKIFLVAFYIHTKEKFIYIDSQKKIECNEKIYYVDFTIEYDDYVNYFLPYDFKLAIECDGYNFHQKTKEQVDNDNQREFDLKMCGYNVLRFSGREIFNTPMECVKKITDYLEYKIKKGMV